MQDDKVTVTDQEVEAALSQRGIRLNFWTASTQDLIEFLQDRERTRAALLAAAKVRRENPDAR